MDADRSARTVSLSCTSSLARNKARVHTHTPTETECPRQESEEVQGLEHLPQKLPSRCCTDWWWTVFGSTPSIDFFAHITPLTRAAAVAGSLCHQHFFSFWSVCVCGCLKNVHLWAEGGGIPIWRRDSSTCAVAIACGVVEYWLA